MAHHNHQFNQWLPSVIKNYLIPILISGYYNFAPMENEQAQANKMTALAWRNAWGNPVFRKKTIIGSVCLVILLSFLPLFFETIEKRDGIQIHDFLLQRMKAYDVSILTFIIIWSMTVFLWIRCIQKPAIFLVALYSLILLFVIRMITITLIPLNPPAGLIPLRDPISSLFYGGPQVFITKDLFFSGHTSTQLMIFFCVEKKKDKILALLSTLTVATLVLVQHVHYTIDVVAALVLTGFIVWIARKITKY
jgi:hypothetical protein